MRLVNIKERMPTREDADSTGQVVWVAICDVYTRNGIGQFHHGSHNSYDRHGLESFRDQVGCDFDVDTDKIFWLEVNSKPALPEVKSHIRKVEL